MGKEPSARSSSKETSKAPDVIIDSKDRQEAEHGEDQLKSGNDYLKSYDYQEEEIGVDTLGDSIEKLKLSITNLSLGVQRIFSTKINAGERTISELESIMKVNEEFKEQLIDTLEKNDQRSICNNSVLLQKQVKNIMQLLKCKNDNLHLKSELNEDNKLCKRDDKIAHLKDKQFQLESILEKQIQQSEEKSRTISNVLNLKEEHINQSQKCEDANVRFFRFELEKANELKARLLETIQELNGKAESLNDANSRLTSNVKILTKQILQSEEKCRTASNIFMQEEQLINRLKGCEEENARLTSELGKANELNAQLLENIRELNGKIECLNDANSRLTSDVEILTRQVQQSEENKRVVANLKAQLQQLKSDKCIKDQDQQRQKKSKYILTNNQELTNKEKSKALESVLKHVMYSSAAVYYTIVLLHHLTSR